MWKKLCYKWFGLSEDVCETCEVLRAQLDESNRERKELLNRLLIKDTPEPLPLKEEEFKPVQSQFVPWRVRQQMLEAEDAKKAQLMRDKTKEIADLESELGIANATGKA